MSKIAQNLPDDIVQHDIQQIRMEHVPVFVRDGKYYSIYKSAEYQIDTSSYTDADLKDLDRVAKPAPAIVPTSKPTK